MIRELATKSSTIMDIDKPGGVNDENHTSRKRKKLESLLKKASKRKVIPPQEDSNQDDGYLTAADETIKTPSFTIIAKQQPTKISNVQHFLPNWLRNPVIISSDLKSADYPIEKIHNLDTLLLHNLLKEGISQLFPVQYEVIPWILKDVDRFHTMKNSPFRPRDLCVSAPTGSGKTLAFAIPIIQSLSKRVVPKIRALVVAPVQELVVQISSVFTKLSEGTKLKVVSCVGGRTPLATEQQKLVKKYNEDDAVEYESLVDILVITPGRLVEHLENTEGFDLRSLRFLVMDEADRMFENVQNDWLYHLEKHLNFNASKNQYQTSRSSDCQTFFPQRLLFSATLSQDPEKLKRLNLFQPVLFSTVVSLEASRNADVTEDYIGSFTTPQGLKEKFIVVDPVLKPLVICELVKRGFRGILCFTKSGQDAHKLSKLLSFLNPAIKISEISSLLPPKERDDILQNFASGSIDMLVSSDVMARGIDINQVKYVISYDAPKHIKSYIHRVGRTGRAGSKGTAITILIPPQAPVFHQMLQSVNKNDVKEMVLDEETLSSWKPQYKVALQDLKLALQKEQLEVQQNENMKKNFVRKTKTMTKKKKKKKQKKVPNSS